MRNEQLDFYFLFIHYDSFSLVVEYLINQSSLFSCFQMAIDSGVRVHELDIDKGQPYQR